MFGVAVPLLLGAHLRRDRPCLVKMGAIGVSCVPPDAPSRDDTRGAGA